MMSYYLSSSILGWTMSLTWDEPAHSGPRRSPDRGSGTLRVRRPTGPRIMTERKMSTNIHIVRGNTLRDDMMTTTVAGGRSANIT